MNRTMSTYYYLKGNTQMKKLLAILLSVVLVASMCTVFAFAEDVRYDETLTVAENGDATYGVANGFTFVGIDYFNGTIKGEDLNIATSLESWASGNPNWAVSIHMRPTETENVYEVVKNIGAIGGGTNEEKIANAALDFQEGDIIFVSHSSSSKPTDATTYPNWEGKVIAKALKAGDKVRFSGVNFEELTLDAENSAYVLMPSEANGGAEEAADKSFNLTYANVYDWAATSVYTFVSTEGKTVVDIHGSADFTYWFQALLQYNEETEKFEVVKYDNTYSGDYVNWTINENQIFVMAHDNCADADSLAVLKEGLAVGDSFYLVGDYNALLTASGAITDTYFTTEEVEHWTPSTGEGEGEGEGENQPTGTPITSVEFTTTVEIVAGNTIFTPVLSSVNGDADLALEAIREYVAIWYNTTDWSEYPVNTVLEAGTEYDLYLRFNAEDGYYFGDECAVTFVHPNGEIIGEKYATNCSDSQYAVDVFVTPTAAEGEGDGEGDGEESGDVSDEESGDVSDEESENEPVVPGDASNMIVFAILALVAVAGSAVVIKSRK